MIAKSQPYVCVSGRHPTIQQIAAQKTQQLLAIMAVQRLLGVAGAWPTRETPDLQSLGQSRGIPAMTENLPSDQRTARRFISRTGR